MKKHRNLEKFRLRDFMNIFPVKLLWNYIYIQLPAYANFTCAIFPRTARFQKNPKMEFFNDVKINPPEDLHIIYEVKGRIICFCVCLSWNFKPSKAWYFNPSKAWKQLFVIVFRRVEISSFRRVEIKRQNRWLKL